MTRRLIVATCLLAALLAAAPSAEAAKRRVPRGFFGTIFDGPVKDAAAPLVTQEFGRMASSGVESVRTNFFWSKGQPSPGVTDFSRTDALVNEAATHGLSLLPVVTAAPRWARQYPSKTGSPPKRVADYTAYLEALVERYGPKGTFWTEAADVPKRPIREWQIWNEPELPYQWHRPANKGFKSVAPAYGALLRASRHTLKAPGPRGEGGAGGTYQQVLERPRDAVRARPDPPPVRRGRAERLLEEVRRLHGDRRGVPQGAAPQRPQGHPHLGHGVHRACREGPHPHPELPGAGS